MIRSKYSRRIRKKKRLGEFIEMGFLIYLYFGEDKDYAIIDSFISLIEKKNFFCGGGGDANKYSFFVNRDKKAITEEERVLIIEEAKKIQGVNHVIAFELVNSWHSNSDAYFEMTEKVIKEYEEEKGI
jgi:uncharacterized protein YggL (DUF469 family)